MQNNQNYIQNQGSAYSGTNMNALNQNQSALSSNSYIPSSVYTTPNQSTLSGQYANQTNLPNNYSSNLNQNQQVNTSYVHSLVSTPSMSSNNLTNQRQLSGMTNMNNNLYNNAYIPSSVYPTPNNSIGSYSLNQNYTASSMQPSSGLTPFNKNSNQYGMLSNNNYDPNSYDVNNNYSYTTSASMSAPNASIGCIVSECRYHAKNQNYCTLNQIQITKHTQQATNLEATDCGSFQSE